MKFKTAIMYVLSLFSASACSSATQIIVQESNGATVYTDNFRVIEAGNNGKKIKETAGDANGILGTLGDMIVVSGAKEPDHIAYVRHKDGIHNYIIKNTLLIQCVRDTECIPQDISAVKLSRSVYEVKVDNYGEWKSMQRRLSSTEGVKNVAPSLYYGIKPSLKNTTEETK
ncbi:MAG: hypothetical protein J6I35_09575 [Ruminobacter sp.]|uniref:hypothetical protein n=1 Tax=Ruminobacter sp. TaxID=2774296 RepID=UPI001B795B4B|nr:hypothetical protein [Ruminobacter sp.]MBP3749772.1 hypothetical protein [Ruminobacter sp.]